MKISIVIPAHNEAKRIQRTIESYEAFFSQLTDSVVTDYEFIVVLNGCTDTTGHVIQHISHSVHNLYLLDLGQAGKGLAVKAGFLDALRRDADLIGFVDADMATSPNAFYELITHMRGVDGVIASRYIPGARIYPPRPFIKRWGSKLFYESLVRLLFGMNFYDYQCGAKIFTRQVIETVASRLTIGQWAFDVELLYLCKLNRYTIREFPTVWHDQAGSTLKMSAGFRMLFHLIKLRMYYVHVK